MTSAEAFVLCPNRCETTISHHEAKLNSHETRLDAIEVEYTSLYGVTDTLVKRLDTLTSILTKLAWGMFGFFVTVAGGIVVWITEWIFKRLAGG